MMDQVRTTALAAILTITSHAGGGFAEEEICEIQILDEENGWPVPIVELRTTNSVRFFSDNRGVIAFDLPDLMGREVWFFVRRNR